MSLSNLLSRAQTVLAARCRPAGESGPAAPAARDAYILFFSLCDVTERAWTCRGAGADFASAWQDGARRCQSEVRRRKLGVRWLRIDWVTHIEALSWGTLSARLSKSKRNYFRFGLALDAGLQRAFLEPEMNANAMLYPGTDSAAAVLNEKNFTHRARQRFGQKLALDFSADAPVWLFTHEGAFFSDDATLARLPGGGQDECSPLWLPAPPHTQTGWRDPACLNAGRRQIDKLRADDVLALIDSGANFLARQVKKDGQFVYGHFPCFGRTIPTYNTLRHASSLYAMLEAWELTRDENLRAAIRRALGYLVNTLIRRYPQPDGSTLAFNVEINGEIKLGANAVSLLALVKYDELTGDTQYRPIMEQLALGIAYMQDAASGSFVHVLNSEDLSVKEAFRIVYYDGEAAFGLMRLYGLTRDPRWLAMVERAFEYFLRAEHWQHHDHWLSYCVNELTLYRPEEKYFRFGVQNIAGYLDFILTRETTFPTLLELSMAFAAMLGRIEQVHPELRHVLDGLDIDAFYRALHHRAHYLLNGFFWPELAMFFARPDSIVGSFFIRHHSFRVRIDDVEHYLSGYAAYWKLLKRTADGGSGQPGPDTASTGHETAASPGRVAAPAPVGPVVAWGGDVNLGRRQHYRTAELGEANVLRVPALSSAALAIVNLECVVTTQGEQGVIKGEGGPYYYRARPHMLRVLAAAGVDVVATANNHSGDYGPEALLEQGQWLDVVGIGRAGSGANRQAALAPVFRRAGDLNVALFAIDATQPRFAAGPDTPGTAYLPLTDPEAWRETLAPRIAAARAQAHVVLVAVHWGVNHATTPAAETVAVGHALIDAGADAVLGASAHLLQGIELYHGRPIVYDAGDLLFDAVRPDLGDSGVFRLELDSAGVRRVCFVPVGCGFGFSEQRTGAEAIAASVRFARQCAGLGTTLTLAEDGSAFVDLAPPPRAVPACAAASQTDYDFSILNLTRPQVAPRWQPAEVPPEARIAPQRVGPLTLVGLRVTPHEFTRRRMLWVESFWRCDAPLDEDLRIDLRAVPVQPTRMRPWGEGMDHDPCDWMLPTQYWQPGVIYRDYYGLRPPYLKNWENVDLQLSVSVIARAGASEPVALPCVVKLAVPGKDPQPRPSAPPAVPVYRSEFPDIIHHCEAGQTWTAEQLEAVTGGQWLVKPPAGWFVRSVVAGAKHIAMLPAPTLFIGHDSYDRHRHEQSKRPTENFDRHRVIAGLVHQLAGAIVCDRKNLGPLPEGFPLLQVADPIKALVELGIAARQRYAGGVFAVTGTVGKSTTAAMLQCMLGGPERILASVDNYNSRVGALAMLANLGMDHEAAIIEIAQSALWMQRGPITRLVRPTIAVITEIGLSQTCAKVKSVADAATWKARIFDGLTGAAVAVLGEHLPCFDYVLRQAHAHAQRVVVFGRSAMADVRILDVDADTEGSWVSLQLPAQALRMRVPLPGPGMVNNAVAALAAVHASGRDLTAAATRLEGFQAGEGRLQTETLQFGDRLIRLIDDSFNAEVASMLNAFAVLGTMPVQDGGRRIAVLGRIAHLGEQARPLHESLAGPLLQTGVSLVITHGEEMHYLRAVLPAEVLGPHFSSAAALAEALPSLLWSGDVVLVKGSRRDSDFGEICGLLRKQGGAG